jgi:protein-disulfide isomerase/uncharacterized membrane protein
MKLKLALVLALGAIGTHLYLTFHYYGLNFGMLEGSAICNLSTTFSCDTVTASPYSSLLGVPMALWGAATNGVLATLLLLWLLGWSEDQLRLERYTLWLSMFIAAASIVMGSLSTLKVGSFCLFCIGAYLLSFVNLWLVGSSQQPSETPTSVYLAQLFGKAKSYLFAVAAIPVVGFVSNYSFITHYGAERLPQIIRDEVAAWRTNPLVDLSVQPSLVGGSPNPKMTLSEFADFRCPHCRHAKDPIDAFMHSHPDVQVRFYTWPLDHACNDAMEAGDGISCYLAKAVYCTEKVAQKGWPLHHYIYDDQESINSNSSMPFAKDQVEKFWSDEKIDKAPIQACIDQPETDAAVKAQAKLGSEAGVKGTPTFFVNGRKLSKATLIPVLEAVHTETEKGGG